MAELPRFNYGGQAVIEGVMNQMDLYRVGADRAEACFVLCDKSGRTDPDAEDSLTVMRSLVLETFNPGMKTFVQARGL